MASRLRTLRRAMTSKRGLALAAGALAAGSGYWYLRRLPTMPGAFARKPLRVGEIRRTAEGTARLMVTSGLQAAVDGPVLSLGEGHGDPTLRVLLELCGDRKVFSCEIDGILRGKLEADYGSDTRVTIFEDALDAVEVLDGQTPGVILCYLPFTSLRKKVVEAIIRAIRATIPEGETRTIVLIQYSRLSERKLKRLLGDDFEVEFYRDNLPSAWIYKFRITGTRRLAAAA